MGFENEPYQSDTIRYQESSSPLAIDMAPQTSLDVESTKTLLTILSLGTMIG
jgi:hypothetical protein